MPGKLSTTGIASEPFFTLRQDVNKFPRLDSYVQPSWLNLLTLWDYKYEPPCLGKLGSFLGGGGGDTLEFEPQSWASLQLVSKIGE
jgi:hypothetical protein